jgi:hypothetical protein
MDWDVRLGEAPARMLGKRLGGGGIADPGAEIRPLGLLAPEEYEERAVVEEAAGSDG